jgi:hypothetical protein
LYITAETYKQIESSRDKLRNEQEGMKYYSMTAGKI